MKTKRYRVSGNWKGRKKATGFRALYLHYCYLLGVFPKNKQQNKRRLHFLLREDLIKLDAITQEARLLGTNHIDTAQQLSSYKETLETRIDALTTQRKQLYRKQRTVAVKSDEDASAEVKAEIDSLSKELITLRREVMLCSDIEVRSGIMQEHIKTIREDEATKRKEQKEHEQRRRCSGTNR